MTYEKTKNTKRFSFGISRNPTSHQAGSNTVTIATRSDDQTQHKMLGHFHSPVHYPGQSKKQSHAVSL